MRPPEREKIDYERIPRYRDWITGKIAEVMYDKEHKSVWEGKERVRFCVRFKFSLDGCSYPHYSPWLTFSYGEKTTLFKKYVKELVDGAQPDMDFDLDVLKGMDVKTMWSEDGEYDCLEMIIPALSKIKGHHVDQDPPPDEVAGAAPGEDIPF
jgi:hypothetical protein